MSVEEPVEVPTEVPVQMPSKEPVEIPTEEPIEMPTGKSAQILPEQPGDTSAQVIAAAVAAALPAADQVEAPRILPRARGPRASQQLPADVASLWGRIEQARIEGGQLWQQAADASRAGQAQVVRALDKVVERQEELLMGMAQQERILSRQEQALVDVAALIREQNQLGCRLGLSKMAASIRTAVLQPLCRAALGAAMLYGRSCAGSQCRRGF